LLRKELELPEFRAYAVNLKTPGTLYLSPTDVLAHFLADVMRRNMNTFRVFGPDETASNKLTASMPLRKRRGSPNTSRRMPTAENLMSPDA